MASCCVSRVESCETYPTMTSSNGSFFCVTGPLCGELTSELPSQRASKADFDVGAYKLFNKQSNDRWFQTTWRSCDVSVMPYHRLFRHLQNGDSWYLHIRYADSRPNWAHLPCRQLRPTKWVYPLVPDVQLQFCRQSNPAVCRRPWYCHDPNHRRTRYPSAPRGRIPHGLPRAHHRPLGEHYLDLKWEKMLFVQQC